MLTFCKSRIQALPDFDALFRRQIQVVLGRHIKRFVPLRHISYRTVCPVHRRRMRVRLDQVAQRLIAILIAPYLGVTKKHALDSREAVNYRRFFTVQ